jgi:energy-converting hydrogenase B subunit D
VIDALSIGLLVLVVVAAIGALRVANLIAAVVIFGAFSFFCAIYFAVLGAVDVAFTEAAVGAAITTLFFVTALYRAGERADR